MPDTQQIIDSIEHRLTAARGEITSLEGAIAALTARAGTREIAPVAARPRRAGTPSPSRKIRRGPGRELPDGAIEQLLQASAEGLSASALITQTGAGQGKVKAQLRRLEQAGDVRSTGARRTSRWHWVAAQH